MTRRAGSISDMFAILFNSARADDSQVLQYLRIVGICFAFGFAFVCAGCSRECDPVELYPAMDEVIGNCHKDGWGVYEDDLDEEDTNEWHGIELGRGDEIVIKERRLKDIPSSLTAVVMWRWTVQPFPMMGNYNPCSPSYVVLDGNRNHRCSSGRIAGCRSCMFSGF